MDGAQIDLTNAEAVEEGIRQHIARSAAHPGGSYNGFANDPAFRRGDVCARCTPIMRSGRFLAVIGPFDPAGWPADLTEFFLSHDRGLDAEGCGVLGCVEIVPPLQGPLARLRRPPIGDTPEGAITPRVLAEAALIIGARCRSGRLAGFTLGRALFGLDIGTDLFDVPALYARIDGFRRGLPPREDDDIPGERLSPNSSVDDAGRVTYLWNSWQGPVTDADLAAAASLPIECEAGWTKPLIPGWECSEPIGGIWITPDGHLRHSPSGESKGVYITRRRRGAKEA
ncbi:MAG: hypothetical protein RIB41_12260 [Oceanibaculum nanhaiense]|jgi:hypothetical protein|uniref:hypothetical protein n=1 Tax=Oceanibaculum nanhaiense TaxID=1909734 RepID=UPI0032EB42DD